MEVTLMKSYRFLIRGRVQGVWYRANVQKNADKSSFNGYVKNLQDGRVEAVVSCEEKRLSDFIALLKKGSQLSSVDEITQREISERFTGGFVVRH